MKYLQVNRKLLTMALAAFLVTPYNASSGVNPIKVQPMFITSNNDAQGADPERAPRDERHRAPRDNEEYQDMRPCYVPNTSGGHFLPGLQFVANAIGTRCSRNSATGGLACSLMKYVAAGNNTATVPASAIALGKKWAETSCQEEIVRKTLLQYWRQQWYFFFPCLPVLPGPPPTTCVRNGRRTTRCTWPPDWLHQNHATGRRATVPANSTPWLGQTRVASGPH